MYTFFRFCVVILVIGSQHLTGQVDNSIGSYPPFTRWHQNPLGVSPIALHTGNGIIIPALVTGIVLMVTENDSLMAERLSFYDDIGYSKGYYGSFTTVYHHNIGVNFMVRDYISAGVEFTQAGVNDAVNRTIGIGLRPFFRFYPVNAENWKLYFSSGAGLMYFFDNFPAPSGFFGDMREGTKLNGSPKYGAAAEFKISRNIAVTAGVWHIHFSNGNHPDFNRNPGHDSNGFSVGINFLPQQ